jgi:hypothetical protein
MKVGLERFSVSISPRNTPLRGHCTKAASLIERSLIVPISGGG